MGSRKEGHETVTPVSPTQSAGRCIMVGFDGPDLSEREASAIERLSPGGVILFRRNLASPERCAALLAELRARLPGPRWFAVDQEGGRVSRLEPWLGATPSAARLAAAGASAAHEFGAATGAALRALGFNLDLAPVVDLCEADAPNGIGDRSFGTDPRRVVTFAGAFLDGLQHEGVAGCLKHFPGQGAATADTHHSLPRVDRAASAMQDHELLPFRELGPRAAAVMVGHAHYPALAPGPTRPACLAVDVVEGALRQGTGFAGLVATDDLEMGALRDFEAEGQDAVLALRAGCDLLLYCRDCDRAERAAAAVVAAMDADPAFAARVRAAAARVERTAALWPVLSPRADAWPTARARVAQASLA